MIKLKKLENLIESFIEEFDDNNLQRKLNVFVKYKREHPDCPDAIIHQKIYNMICELLAPMENEGLVLNDREKHIIYVEMIRAYNTYVPCLYFGGLYNLQLFMYDHLILKAKYIKCTQKLSMHKNRRTQND